MIDKLKSGEQEKAEFWINKPGVFLYIVYVAVKDEQGHFRGVLEIMQDCTHIRELEGSQTLLTWANDGNAATDKATEEAHSETETAADINSEDSAEPITTITPDTKLKVLLKQYPFLKKRLVEIASAFRMLQSPLGKLIVSRADVKMMSEKSGVPLERLVEGITTIIKDEAQKQG